MLADVKAFGDRAIGRAVGDQTRHFGLARAQREGAGRLACGRAAGRTCCFQRARLMEAPAGVRARGRGSRADASPPIAAPAGLRERDKQPAGPPDPRAQRGAREEALRFGLHAVVMAGAGL